MRIIYNIFIVIKDKIKLFYVLSLKWVFFYTYLLEHLLN